MDAIMEKAKEIGLLIKEDDRVKRIAVAEVALSADFGLQKKIQQFNEARNKMFELMDKGVEDKAIVDPLNEEIKKIYDEVMANPVMKEYDDAKNGLENLMNEVNNVINFYVTGEEQGCSPSKCSSCQGGCQGH